MLFSAAAGEELQVESESLESIWSFLWGVPDTAMGSGPKNLMLALWGRT